MISTVTNWETWQPDPATMQTAYSLPIEKNITIRNGTIRGFFAGIYFYNSSSGYTNSSGHLVEDVHLDSNFYDGVKVLGSANVIRRNRVADTGGSTYYSNAFAYGISAYGSDCRIADNQVINTFAIGATGNAYAITVGVAPGAVVMNNMVSGITAIGGATSGIFYSGDGGIFDSNKIMRASGTGGAISINGGSVALCSNTLAIGFTTPTSGCTNGGGNVSVP